MSVVNINALSGPEGHSAELERRFADRAHGVAQQVGFERFQLLRPMAGEPRCCVVRTWRSEDVYLAWRDSDACGSRGGTQPPVATGSQLMEFELVEL